MCASLLQELAFNLIVSGGAMAFAEIPAFARTLAPAVVAHISALNLDHYPDDITDWQELLAFPALKKLTLNTTLSHQHLPHIAGLGATHAAACVLPGLCGNLLVGTYVRRLHREKADPNHVRHLVYFWMAPLCAAGQP